ncbi:MAG: FKBP-type peptidyl-prolyl cis-trans isomerase [Gammaproteobacteria bacterium]|nr:FKBP-type peptidyl-prolyl cis-trans isomerase [Gammaproteobacteria bacterium]
MSTEPVIAPGSRVRMHYRLMLPDGKQLAGSGEEPELITMGDGTLVEGLEALLMGLSAGAHAQWDCGAKDMIYGWTDEELVQTMSLEEFPEEMDLTPGNVVLFNSPGGTEVLGVIESVQDGSVWVDFNHPLSGRDFRFEVEILEVEPPG